MTDAEALASWTNINTTKILADAKENVIWTQSIIDKWKQTKADYKRNKEIDKDILKDFLQGCSDHVQHMTNTKQFWETTVKNFTAIEQAKEDVKNGIPLKSHYAGACLELGEMKDGEVIRKSRAYYYDLYVTEEDFKSGNYEIPTDGKWMEM